MCALSNYPSISFQGSPREVNRLAGQRDGGESRGNASLHIRSEFMYYYFVCGCICLSLCLSVCCFVFVFIVVYIHQYAKPSGNLFIYFIIFFLVCIIFESITIFLFRYFF